ncbi:hypothetical protein acsn021_28960 [Anaerocolumna cellulosilytica]|uniref:Uncharacterized protein n=1 Tax=Anaerocolumna cellulosilytica TaxID=433286 RepID=A0A6S6R5F3_9FIRM|nr:helix-turn-helix transcriptional regulator [Anaerocolumna cellulosilytica]MBB5197114.1 transcriptional regulator with XRE-family HTH domain [Anaerocolumna cellulosilytica]BCJ95327.1 hypothetical protein acsn021_28960 [Anaerocolumna cellulosilytica]
MEKRVKLIRKSLNLSQKKFGDRLGLKPNSISSIETGKNTLTDQNIKMICSTFQINEDWLRTGNGEMYTKHLEIDNELSIVINEIVKSNDKFVKQFLNAYWSLSKENRTVISDFIDKLKE